MPNGAKAQNPKGALWRFRALASSGFCEVGLLRRLAFAISGFCALAAGAAMAGVVSPSRRYFLSQMSNRRGQLRLLNKPTKVTTMRYMLMMNAPRGTGDYAITAWSPDDIKAHMGFMHTLNKELAEAGELVGCEGLASPGEAKIVRAGKNGVPAVTDGPFPETKEFLAGYWIIDVDQPQRAYEIAAKVSTAPGPGGTPLIIPVEVRQVMSLPPDM